MKAKNGWEYNSIVSEKGYQFEILIPDLTERPKILYKLYPLNQFSFDALINGYVYATHPSQFNDIFDCHDELVRYDDDTVVEKILKKYNDTNKVRHLLQNEKQSTIQYLQRNLKEIIFRKWGVFSMTVNPNNIMMWSYYTDHQGFMIEFDIRHFSTFKYHGPFPINYQETIEPISMKEWGFENSILYQTNVKYNGWEHEEEWRLIIDSEGKDMFSPSYMHLKELGGRDRKFKYPISAIQSISLGNRFFIPEELNETNTVLEINLIQNLEKKSLLLDFLVENDILTRIALRHSNLTSINFGNGKVERVNYKQYKIHKI